MIYAKNPRDTTKIKQQRVIPTNEPTKKTSRVIKHSVNQKKEKKNKKKQRLYGANRRQIAR